VTAYRFCRTDDMALLVQAYEHCRGPEDDGAPTLDRGGFKDLVRDLDLWCSSCMVALEGREPVGVLLGAKRDEATLVYGLRVHPAHRRRGHGRHLLTSLGQKLAILGPPRLVAEVPAERVSAQALFDSLRWRSEARLVDWRRTPPVPAPGSGPTREVGARTVGPVAPVDLEQAIAGGLLGGGSRCWHRDLRSLDRAGQKLLGLGFHSQERLEACLFARPRALAAGWEILAAGSTGADLGRAGLRILLSELERRACGSPLELARAAPGEIESSLLAELGYEPGPEHVLFATEAQAA
jgi:ribosomal protein S18 acetylase RimI-like enzyme